MFFSYLNGDPLLLAAAQASITAIPKSVGNMYIYTKLMSTK